MKYMTFKRALGLGLIACAAVAMTSCGGGGGGGDDDDNGFIMPLPDLDIRNFRVNGSTSDATLTAGASFTIRADVYNFPSEDPASGVILHYYRSTNNVISRSDTRVGSDTVGSLGAGQTSSQSITLTAPTTTGVYYYGACVDEVAGERDPGDDCTTDSEAIRVTVTTRSPNPGGSIRFTLTDQCTIGAALHARFFGYVGTSTTGSPDIVWPSSRNVYTTNNRRTTGSAISVTLGASGRGIGVICYGAELENTPNLFWGVGLGGNRSCSNCCVTVPSSGTSSFSRDLRCP